MASTASIADRATLERRPHRRFQRASETEARSAWPSGLFGMFVLVTAIELGILATGPRYIDPIVYSWCFSARQARVSAAGCDVLYLGDSLVKHSMIPDALDRATGRHSYNLAAAAGSVPMTHTRPEAPPTARQARGTALDMKPSVMIGGPLATHPGAPEAPGLGRSDSRPRFPPEGNGRPSGEPAGGALAPTHPAKRRWARVAGRRGASRSTRQAPQPEPPSDRNRLGQSAGATTPPRDRATPETSRGRARAASSRRDSIPTGSTLNTPGGSSTAQSREFTAYTLTAVPQLQGWDAAASGRSKTYARLLASGPPP